AVPVPSMNPQLSVCSPHVLPDPCGVITANDTIEFFCFNPYRGKPLRQKVLTTPDAQNGTIDLGQYKWSWGCFAWKLDGNFTCCSNRKLPSYCKCATDCSWMDKRNTYERCGALPIVSTACDPYNATSDTCVPRVVAGLDLPGFSSYYTTYHWPTLRVLTMEGKGITIRYDSKTLEKLPPARWARLPFRPVLSHGSWMVVPKGFYSSYTDLSTGLITKDKHHEDYQLHYTASGALSMEGVTYHIIVIALLAALGAKWCLVIYATLLMAGVSEA
nr:envelope protein E2 [Norway rat hepacivirus 2]